MTPGRTDGAETLGARLKAARLRKSATLSQAAEATRIKSSQLGLMEADRFGEVGAAVYVRGFLRLYGEYLGLDAEALVQEYRRLYGEPRPTIDPDSLPGVVRRRTAPSPDLAPPTDLGMGDAGDSGMPPGRDRTGAMVAALRRALSALTSPGTLRAARAFLLSVGGLVALLFLARGLGTWAGKWREQGPAAPVGWVDVIEPPPSPYFDPQMLKAATPPRSGRP